MLVYDFQAVKNLFKQFPQHLKLDNTYISVFQDIKKNNVFNPKQFSYKKINYNNWRKSMSKEEEGKKNERDIILEKIKTILNKCTNNNFETLKNKLIEFIKGDNDILNITLGYIFEMATLQNIYCQVYANIGKFLYENYGETVKKQLLDKCKKYFKEHSKKTDIDTTDYDKFCIEMKKKKRFIGVFTLVACFYSNDMVKSHVIRRYINLFLNNLDGNMDKTTQEKYVETLKKLFLRVYKKLQIEQPEELNKFVKEIEILLNNDKFSNREKFMFEDILDLF